MPDTALTIITDALQELGILNPVDAPSGEDAALGLRTLNRILDTWNADRQAVFSDTLAAPYPITPNLQPHTIGPTGTFTAAVRPVSIEAANLVLADDARVPLEVHQDKGWLASLSQPETTSTWPSDLHYDPAWPNGKLYLWPIPTEANLGLELLTRGLLAALALADTFSLPPGYQDALTLTLAEKLAAPFHVPIPPKVEQDARAARARIFANNELPRRIATHDAGMPGGSGGAWDWRTGSFR